MKQFKDYFYLIPAWMREDENFRKFYTDLVNIFLDCQKANEDIIKSFTGQYISSYDKSLEILASYFGVNRNFYLSSGNKVTAINVYEDSYDYTADSVINIKISNEVLFRIIKFKLLMSNFDGTIKSLLNNYNILFANEPINIQFIEDTFTSEPDNIVYPALALNIPLNDYLATPEGLKEATLFLNGAYTFNYMGVIIRYSLGGRTAELVWDESDWDKSKWKI